MPAFPPPTHGRKAFEDAVKEDSKFQYLGVQYSKNDPATAANLIGSALQKGRTRRSVAAGVVADHPRPRRYALRRRSLQRGRQIQPSAHRSRPRKVVAVLQECEPDRTHSLTR